MSPSLTPVQDRVVTGLMGRGQPRPTFDPGLARRLRAGLTDALAMVADRLELAGLDLHVSKRALSRIHQCERHAAEHDFEGWTPALARGTVAHKALELATFLTSPRPPLEVVDLALERLAAEPEGWGPGPWLAEAGPAEVAEVRSAAVELVTKFEECFPPLKPAWRPRFESSLRVPLFSDRVVLGAKVDLALGQAEGTEARVLVIDFKSGRVAPGHVDDLRYYALLHTLRTGVPPFRVASYYLDAGSFHAEDVTENILDLAVRRVIDGVVKLSELRLNERAPTATAGPLCRYCRLAPTCEAALAAAAEALEAV